METLYEETDDGFGGGHGGGHEVLQQRLDKVRKDVRKATQEAWKKAGHGSSAGKLGVGAGAGGDENRANSSSMDHNASFLLGMELFGRGTEPVDVENAVRDKLEEIEEELHRLQVLAAADDDGGDGNNNDMNDGPYLTSAADIDRQIQSYKAKIEFLKLASKARTFMEECTGLVSPALTSEPDWVLASKKLIDALRSIDEATEVIQRQQEQVFDQQQQEEQQKKEIAVAYQIINSLRHQVRRRRVNLQQKACGILDGSLVEMTSNSIIVQSSDQLMMAYQVLENLHQRPPTEGDGDHPSAVPPALDDVIRRLTRRLYQSVLKPIIVSSSLSSSTSTAPASACPSWTVEESSDKRIGMLGVSQAQKRGTIHVIEWELDKKKSNSVTVDSNKTPFDPLAAWKNLLEVLQRILTFVQTKVLLERESLCRLVGARLFGRPAAVRDDIGFDGLNLEALGLQSTLLGEGDNGVLMAGLIDWLEKHCLDGVRTTSVDDLSLILSFQKDLCELSIPFCREMVLRHLMERDPAPKLVTFSKNFSKEVVEYRRRTLLNTARVLLAENDYHNTVVVGKEEQRDGEAEEYNKKELEIFDLPKCSVSDTANKLMALVRQTMDEAVAVSIAYPPPSSEADEAAVKSLGILRPTLYRTAREMLSLFRSIIPSSHRREVSNVPRTAAVLHNDSVFIANHCLTLGLEYKEKFPTADDDDIRGKLLKQTCVFVDMVPLFRELADSSMGDMLDLQQRQLADIVGGRISYFGKSLRSNESLLEWSEAETAIAAGIYHLRHLSQGWKPILAYSVFLRSMGYLIDVVVSLYLEQLMAATSISPSARYFVSALCQKAVVDLSGLLDTPKPAKYVPAWGRFVAVSKYLELNHLSDLEQALSYGVFRELGSQELCRLIQAGFPDSSERHALLSVLVSRS